MDGLLVYHNPGCSKSRGTLELLRERSVEFDVVEYLKNPPDRAALGRILDRLADAPAELVRKDKRFKELGLNESDYESRDAVVEVLLEHPELMQRPVVLRGERAVLARPSEKVVEILA